VLSAVSLTNADDSNKKIEQLESQVQDALIKIKAMEKKTKTNTEIKAGPGLTIKYGKNEVKLAGRAHFDIGMHDADPILGCDVANSEGGSCFTDGTNFRRLRLGVSGKYGGGYYYKTQFDWGASAKQGSDTIDNASVDEAFMGYKLSKSATISIGKQKIPVSFAESTSSNDLTFIERAPSVDTMTDETIGPKRMSIQYRTWDKKMGYLLETAIHGAGDTTSSETFDEQLGYTGRIVYAPIMNKTSVIHLGYWYDFSDTDTADITMEWNYRIGLNISDEKPIDADIGSDLGDVNNMTHWGGEVAMLYNGFWVAGEWIWGKMERENGGLRNGSNTVTCTSVEANMGYYEAGYTFGGQRTYAIKKGGWKRSKVKKPVNKGGPGVHEFGFRYDNSSLNDLCNGYGSQGSMRSTTLGWNWQLNNNNRIMVNYITANLDAEAVDEITSLAPGANFGSLTNSYGNENKVKALGIRFQTNW